MKIGLSSYSFSKLLRKGLMKPIEVVSEAKNMGFDIIEFAGLPAHDAETPLTFALRLKEICEATGIEIGNYSIGADFLNCPDGDWKAETDRLKEEVRVAKALSASGMRHDCSRGFPVGYTGSKGFDNALPVLINACREVTEFASDLGVKTMVENHGFFCQDSERVEKLINGVNHPNFGALVDIGNFLCVDESPEKAVGRLMPYAFHVHAKDFFVKSGMMPAPGQGWFSSRGGNYLRGTLIGHGDVPVTQCLQIMKKAKYNGTISIEFEGMEDPIEGIAICLNNLRSFINHADM
jgi:sugar phosphate isomerase/epimerase